MALLMTSWLAFPRRKPTRGRILATKRPVSSDPPLPPPGLLLTSSARNLARGNTLLAAIRVVQNLPAIVVQNERIPDLPHRHLDVAAKRRRIRELGHGAAGPGRGRV